MTQQQRQKKLSLSAAFVFHFIIFSTTLIFLLSSAESIFFIIMSKVCFDFVSCKKYYTYRSVLPTKYLTKIEQSNKILRCSSKIEPTG
jgi:hypothetical protein